MTGTLMVYGAEAAFLVLVLAILEISLSMDNAVVNASVLKDMTNYPIPTSIMPRIE
jgi:hypothetical protein